MAVTGERARAGSTYARLARWMLAVLLPLIGVMTLGGGALLAIYGPSFRAGELWLAIVSIACATNAFVGLAEVVLMVERPRLNLLNSTITATVAVAANLWLISRFGITGAAFGILLPYVLQGVLRGVELRILYGWRSRWRELVHPCLAGAGAAVPGIAVRLGVDGLPGQLAAAAVFLLAYAAIWWRLGLDAADRAILNELLGRSPSPTS
jgi:O-antigen/teichoic acid export membrane protein